MDTNRLDCFAVRDFFDQSTKSSRSTRSPQSLIMAKQVASSVSAVPSVAELSLPRLLKSLDPYGGNLSELAASRKQDPVIGRLEQLDRTIEVLSRRQKCKPILIGLPGVGKGSGKGISMLMFDGTIKNVEDVVAGDLLMGDVNAIVRFKHVS
jgi:ATP-dependent Clp protease ATP-binding subunit ClpA